MNNKPAWSKIQQEAATKISWGLAITYLTHMLEKENREKFGEIIWNWNK